MKDLGELVGGRRTDTLRGRVCRHPLRVRRFQCAQLLHEPVVLGIRHLRLIKDVVAVVVLLDLAPQMREALLQLGLGGGCRRHDSAWISGCGVSPHLSEAGFAQRLAASVEQIAPQPTRQRVTDGQ